MRAAIIIALVLLSTTILAEDRFIRNPEGIIIDTETNLEWYIGPDSRTSWRVARDWIDNLDGSWRMPTVEELRILYEAGVKPQSKGDMFGLYVSGWMVWTGERVSDQHYYYFDFSAGVESCWYAIHNADGFRAFAVK